MRILRAGLIAGLIAWALATLYVILMVRERYGRRGPIPVSQARALLHPLRSLIQPAGATVQRLRLRPGDTALEVGPGPGYFTIEAARTVGPAGRVICLDVQPEMLPLLCRRLDESGTANACPLAGDATRLPLADGCVDAAFLVAVLGEVPDRPAALRELRRVLKPGAALTFCETMTDPDYVFQASLRDLCRASGFEEQAVSRNVTGYTMTFVVPG